MLFYIIIQSRHRLFRQSMEPTTILFLAQQSLSAIVGLLRPHYSSSQGLTHPREVNHFALLQRMILYQYLLCNPPIFNISQN